MRIENMTGDRVTIPAGESIPVEEFAIHVSESGVEGLVITAFDSHETPDAEPTPRGIPIHFGAVDVTDRIRFQREEIDRVNAWVVSQIRDSTPEDPPNVARVAELVGPSDGEAFLERMTSGRIRLRIGGSAATPGYSVEQIYRVER